MKAIVKVIEAESGDVLIRTETEVRDYIAWHMQRYNQEITVEIEWKGDDIGIIDE